MRKRPGGQTAHLVAKRWRGYDGSRYGDNDKATGIRDRGQGPPAAWQAIYGDRLRGVYLYGSGARDQLTPDSDIDIAVILDAAPDRFAEHERTSELVPP